MTNAQLILSSTSLVYQISPLSQDLKLYWSHLLEMLFGDALSNNEIQFLESKGASLKIHSRDELQEMSKEELIEGIALINLLLIEAERCKDFVSERSISTYLAQLVDGLSKIEFEETQRSFEQYHESITKLINRGEILVPANITILYIDFFIRCLLLSVFANLSANQSEDPPWFWFIHFLFLTIVMIGLAGYKETRIKRANHELLSRFGGDQQFKVRSNISAGKYTIVVLFFAIGVCVTYLLSTSVLLTVVAFMSLLIYYFLLLNIFSTGRISENNLIGYCAQFEQDDSELTRDELDEEIVNIQSKLDATSGRLETYVFESALFGALTFGGFIQIMAENLVSFSDLENFALHIYQTSHALVHLQPTQMLTEIQFLNSKTNLFCLVAVETLFCSILFLAVIGSRLRFSDVADGVRQVINLIKAKESQDVKIEELQRLYKKAQVGMKRMIPIIEYMRFFRMAGTLTFLLILISSSLFISSTLVIVFAIMVFASWVYFNYDYLIHSVTIVFFIVRNYFLSRGSKVMLLILCLLLLSLLLRTVFHVDSTDFLLVLGIIIFGVYSLIYFILLPFHDDSYNTLKQSVQERLNSRRLKIVMRIIGVFVAFSSIGLLLKLWNLGGFSEFMTLSFFVLSLTWVASGYYLVSLKWIGVACGISLWAGTISILFYMINLPGALEMYQIFLFSQLVTLPAFVFFRKNVHAVFINVTIFLVCLSTMIFSGILNQVWIAYEHQTISWNEVHKLSELENEIESYTKLFEEAKATDQSFANLIDHTKWYLDQYSDRFGVTNVMKNIARNYYFMSIMIIDFNHFENEENYYEQGLVMAKMANEFGELFQFNQYPFTRCIVEAETLMKMKRTKEAEEFLQEILNVTTNLQVQEKATQLLGEVKKLREGLE